MKTVFRMWLVAWTTVGIVVGSVPFPHALASAERGSWQNSESTATVMRARNAREVRPQTGNGSTRVPFPGSMGAAGDSVTRAFDVNVAGELRDNLQYSWSTGSSASVDSQYRRILSRHRAILGHAYNYAQTGSLMSALDGQLRGLAGKHVAYVTVLMGHNDVCTPTIRGMKPVSTFKSEFHRALADFFSRDRKAHVFVSSLLDIYRLWQVLHKNRRAENIWQPYRVCGSMLSSSDTESQRQAVLRREKAFNSVVAGVCKDYSNCRWDGGAAFKFRFTASAISTVDYFHPNVAGQESIAAITWTHGFWP